MTANHINETRRNQTDQRANDAYMREFVPAIVAYSVLVSAVLLVANAVDLGGWVFPFALLPLVPVGWVVRAVARHVVRADEFQRTIILTSMSIGFGTAMFVAVAIGLLAAAGMTTGGWTPWAIFAVGMLAWAVAGAWLSRTRGGPC